MKAPAESKVEIALMWLRTNEGNNGESDACREVADWLEDTANDYWLRSKAREAGIPIARLRRRMAEYARR